MGAEVRRLTLLSGLLLGRIRQGERIPNGYGVAWLDFTRCEAVCLPLPLNVVAWIGWSVWTWMLQPFYRPWSLPVREPIIRAVCTFSGLLLGLVCARLWCAWCGGGR